MAKKKKAPKEEIIPEGMSRKQYADKAFRKKVTIINMCLLSVFLIGVVIVLVVAWHNTNVHNAEFEQKAAAFKAEKDAIILQLEEIEENGGTHEDKSKVKINVTDETFYDWITLLDDTYQAKDDDEIYAAFGGAEIHLQGMFFTNKLSENNIQYWVYRKHSHEGHEHAHENEEDGKTKISDMVPIEVIFDEDVEIPEDGTWVDIVGIVGPDSTKNLSGIRYAKMTIMDEPGQEYVE